MRSAEEPIQLDEIKAWNRGIIERFAETLKVVEHPRPTFRSRGKTMHDYCLYIMRFGQMKAHTKLMKELKQLGCV